MSEHRQEFDNELEAIESKVIELFAMVAEGVPVATQALLNGDDAAFATLAERDREIDALYVEVEGLANREILLQAPVASDLRFLLSVLRIVPELERSHDLHEITVAGDEQNAVEPGRLQQHVHGQIEIGVRLGDAYSIFIRVPLHRLLDHLEPDRAHREMKTLGVVAVILVVSGPLTVVGQIGVEP